MWLLLILVTAVIIWLSTNRRYRWFYMVYKTLPRDIKMTWVFFKIYNTARVLYNQKLTLSKAFSLVAKRNPQKIAYYFEDEEWTIAQVEEFSNKITRYFMNEGYKDGDTVALLMENCPEYGCIILGLSRIGVITALINSNILKDPLVHSITVVKPKAVILGGSSKKFLEEVASQVSNVKVYQLNRLKDNTELLEKAIDLKEEMCRISGKIVEKIDYEADPKDPIIYIYTSGTTGLPKASVLTQLKYLLISKTFALVCELTQDDILYVPLPLYHTSGVGFGISQALVAGIPVVIKRKFSATNYFADCAKYNVTVASYIGEMCRYVLANSSQLKIEKHKLRLMIGNGLKSQIWKTFAAKFNVKRIIELYGSTEGVSNFVNLDGTVGAIGCIPWFLKRNYPVTLLKCDENGQLIKNADGRYIECAEGEAGVVVGKIDESKAVLRFDGYTDKTATNRKILKDVFQKGDMYFNSGDILVYDEFRYFYFKDRTGDTFRWKGENVSTNEIEAVISNLVKLADVVVYGVEVPHTEGRAGMAAIMDPANTLDTEALATALKSNLPSYAIPIFIRVMESIPLTGTFKLKKVELRNEGYNLDKTDDKIYFFDSKAGKYVRFDKALYENVKNGNLRM